MVPFVLSYLLNWIIYLLLLAALCTPKVTSKPQQKAARSRVQKYTAALCILSIFFAVAWVFALIGTRDVPMAVHEIAQYIFAVFITLHAVFTLILHTLRTPEVKQVWMRLWYLVTCKGQRYAPNRAYVTHEPQRFRETDLVASRSFEGGVAPTLSDEVVPLSPATEPEPCTNEVLENRYVSEPSADSETSRKQDLGLEEGGGVATEL